jgi:putative flippase GtrA
MIVPTVAGSFARFSVAGAVGFVIDAGVLSLIVRATQINALSARLVSMTLAITATWLINRQFTFRTRRTLPGHVEYAGYFAIQLVGVVINYAVFAASLRLWPALEAVPVLAAAAGSVSAMLLNFLVARRVLYAYSS